MVCPPVQWVIHLLKLVNYHYVQTILYLSLVHAKLLKTVELYAGPSLVFGFYG